MTDDETNQGARDYLEARSTTPIDAILRCADCEEMFSGELPPLYVDMPECPLCGSGPVALIELLESAHLKH